MNTYTLIDKSMLAFDVTKMSSMGLFLDFPNQIIPNISNLYNPNENLSLESQTKCDNMFSYPVVE